MKRLLLFMLCLLFAAPSFSQTRQDIYLVGTSSVIPEDFVGIFDGFGRIDIKKESFDKDDPISFRIGNPKIEYTIVLYHYNLYNKERPDLRVCDMKISDLGTLQNGQIINIDEFFADKTKEDVWQWMIYHHLSKTTVWVVDYTSAYKSSEDLSAPDMVKAVQVKIFTENIPTELRREYYKAYHDAQTEKD